MPEVPLAALRVQPVRVAAVRDGIAQLEPVGEPGAGVLGRLTSGQAHQDRARDGELTDELVQTRCGLQSARRQPSRLVRRPVVADDPVAALERPDGEASSDSAEPDDPKVHHASRCPVARVPGVDSSGEV